MILRITNNWKLFFEAPGYDAGGISRSRKRDYEIDYFSYNGKKQVIVPVSDTYKKFSKKLKKQFGDKQVFISSRTDEEDKMLLYVTSDKLYGEYHIYDVEKDEFKMLLNLMPQLKENDMAEMKPIEFTSRDGLKVEGYITLPKAALEGKKGSYDSKSSWRALWSKGWLGF